MSFEDWVLVASAAMIFLSLVVGYSCDRVSLFFSPFVCIGIPIVLGTPVKLAALFLGNSDAVREAFSGLSVTQLQAAVTLVFGFLLVFSAGYFVTSKLSPYPEVRSQSKTAAPKVHVLVGFTVVAALVSLVALAVLLKTSGANFTSLGDISAKRRLDGDSGGAGGGGLRTLTGLVRVNAVVLMAYCWRVPALRSVLSIQISILCSLVVILVISVLTSERTQLILFVLPLLGVLHSTKAIGVKGLALICLLVLIFGNAVVALRNNQANTLGGFLSSATLNPFLISEGLNGSDITKLSRIVDYVDNSDGLLWGRSIYNIPLMLIPRAIYPNKPTLDIDVYITREIYGREADVSMGRTPPSLIGELYLNFSLVGVLVGAALYGILLRLLYSLLYCDEPVGAFVFLLLYPMFTYMLNMTFFFAPVAVSLRELAMGLLLIACMKFSSRITMSLRA